GLRRAIGGAVGGALDRGRARRQGDDRAGGAAFGRAVQHAGQEGRDGAVHALDGDVEGNIPVGIGGLQYGAVMGVAGDVDEDVDLADLCGVGIDRARRGDVELGALHPGDVVKLGAVDVAGVDGRAFLDEGL